METISRSLLTFLLNALWQDILIAAVAAMVCQAMRKGPAGHRHAVWVAALAAAILLPLASLRPVDETATPHWTFADPPPSDAAVVPRANPLPAAPARPVPRSVSLAEATARILVLVYLLFLA